MTYNLGITLGGKICQHLQNFTTWRTSRVVMLLGTTTLLHITLLSSTYYNSPNNML